MAKVEKIIEIVPLDIKRVKIRIVGDSPLLVHAWSDKAKKMILDVQTGATTTRAKEKKNPVSDFINSIHWIEGKPEKDTMEAFEKAIQNGAKTGFPVGAIKQAANSAAYRLKWVKNQMELRGTYFLLSEYGTIGEIKGCFPKIQEDMFRVGMGTADIRYRAVYENWYMDFILEYNASGGMSLEQILNCINAGGYACGIGEWRPEKDGILGRFHVEVAE